MDIAELGIRISDTGTVEATQKLKGLGDQAQTTEQKVKGANQGIEDSFQKAGDGVRRTSIATKDAIDNMFNPSNRNPATAARDVEQYANELDELRAKFNPLFRVSRQYENTIEEIARAERLGAIGAAEAANAREDAARAMTVAGTQMGRFGNQTRVATGHTANLFAQMNDIGVMLAAGQSPLMLAVQQGSQINQVFAQMGGGRTALAGLGTAITSMISPLNLMTIGVIAGGAALVQWGASAIGASSDAETFEDALDGLENAVSQYREIAERAASTNEDLRESFGGFGEGLRDVSGAVAEIARASALTQVQDTASAFGGQFEPGFIESIRQSLITATATTSDFEEAIIAIQNQFDITAQQAEVVATSLQGIGDAGDIDGVLAATEAFNQNLLMVFGTADNIPEPLRQAALESYEMARAAAEMGAEIDAADAAQKGLITSTESLTNAYQLYAATRSRSDRDAADAQAATVSEQRAMLDAMNDEIAMQQLIFQYGQDSLEVAQERLNISLNQYDARLQEMGITGELRAELMQAYETQLLMEQVNLGGPIAEAAAMALGLADALLAAQLRLNAIAARAAIIQGSVGPDAVISQQQQEAQIYGVVSTLNVGPATRSTGGAGGRGSSGSAGGMSEEEREAQQRQNELMRDAERWIERTRTAAEQYAIEIEDLAELQESGYLTGEAYARSVAMVSQEFRDTQFEPFISGIEDISGAFADAIVNGDNLGDAFRGVVQRMAADLIQSGLQNLILSAFSFGAAASPAQSLFGGLFGGFRASGGPVEPGKAYVVGEKGPELFSPGVSGNIIPNGASASAEPSTFNFYGGDSQEIISAVQSIVAEQQSSFAPNVQRAMSDPRFVNAAG